jgi:nucleoside-diphosphate-sugar epimerase
MITGATGYVGSPVAAALGGAGYEVCGLARSLASARELRSRGYMSYTGDIKEPGDLSRAILESGARAIVHAATTGDSEAEEADRNAVEDSLGALRDTGRTFIYTSGGWVMGETPGSPEEPEADEETVPDPAPSLRWRPAVERRVLAAAASHDVRTFVVRPALVYGEGGGVVAELVQSARKRGSARYVVGDEPGSDPLWTLVHTADLGDLYARILGSAEPGGTLVIAAGTRPVPVRDIASETSRLHGTHGSHGTHHTPEPWPLSEARRELGVYADSLVLSQRLSGDRARRLFGWEPSGPSVLEELETGSYAPAKASGNPGSEPGGVW